MKISSLLLTLLAATALQLSAATVPVRTDVSALNTGNAEQQYRHRSFGAYLPQSAIRQKLKIGGYSSFENPTGIFFREGESVTLQLKGSAGQQLKLIVHDFEKDGAHDEYPLKEGENKLNIKHKGLGYVDYRSETPAKAPQVKADITGGSINGIFTRADNGATWQKLLAEAKCNILDIMGERCQLTYDIEGLKKGCPNEGPEMLKLYDEIIRMEQEDILGWHLDKSHPGNHIHGRVQWRGFMHADGMGAAYIFDAIPGITNPKKLREAAWGVAHEFGHVNQTSPGMKWIGTTEVTNNICSAWVNYRLHPERLRLEHEVTANAEGERMLGGRFDCYINNAIVRRRLWQFHGGPDFDGIKKAPTDHPGDHFVSVCPLWQLQLYHAVVRKDADFYPRIFANVRATDESKMSNGELRVLFFKRACDSAKLDLSEFFVKTGMLAPVDRLVRDYSTEHLTITEKMCLDAINYASRYPRPDSSVLYYLCGNNADIFRKKLNVVVPKDKQAPAIVNTHMEIPADLWKNAVAFEAYKGKKLLHVSLRGLNHEDKASTTVVCPEGTDCVKAVQWNGKRYKVMGK